jgi:hypothetical protein
VTDTTTITREVYEAFQRVELHRWDAVIAADVLVNSPAAFGLKGLHALKEFAVGFTHLGWRIDLVDEHLALDDQGNGRGFITLTLHWKHTKDFGGLAPTGREGTGVPMLAVRRRPRGDRPDRMTTRLAKGAPSKEQR